MTGDTVKVLFAKPEGAYVPSIKSYRVRVHSAMKVEIGGKQVAGTTGTDKFGAYREVVVPVTCAGCLTKGGKLHTK